MIDGLLEDLWHIYNAQTQRQFAQRLRRCLEWVKLRDLPAPVKQRLLRLPETSHYFQRAYDFPGTDRTHNQVDRPMNYLDRRLYASAWTLLEGLFHQRILLDSNQ